MLTLLSLTTAVVADAQPLGEKKDSGEVPAVGPATSQAVAPGAERQEAGNVYVLLDSVDQFGPVFTTAYSPSMALPLGDDDELSVPLGFNFAFYGFLYTDVVVAANGGLILGTSGDLPAANHVLDSPVASERAIYPFWDDLDPDDPDSDGVYVQTFGPPNQRVFVVEWRDVVHYQGGSGETVTFQVRLFEDHSRIEFHYYDVIHGGSTTAHDGGATATVGIDRGTTGFLEYSVDTASLTAPFAVDFFRPFCGGVQANVVGTRGVDVVSVVAGDSYYGHHGNDLITLAGPDASGCGGNGDDTLQSSVMAGALLYGEGAGLDRTRLFTGNDRLAGTPAADILDGGSGDDTMYGFQGADRISGGPGRDRIWGGDDADVIHGGSEIDYIRGQGGEDEIRGDGGSDRIWGGSNDDTIHAGSGADRVWGGSGADTLNGMGGQDQMWGEGGADIMQGNWQSDWLYGGTGPDVVRGAAGKDKLFGNAGDDQLFGGLNTDYLNGGVGYDVANGQEGRDGPLVHNVSGCVAEVKISC